MADRYFKRPNGDVVLATPNLDIKSLEDRFEECDQNTLVTYLEVIVNYLDILPVSEMARAENKSRNGILISNNYRKVQIGKSKLAVKGVKDDSFPF